MSIIIYFISLMDELSYMAYIMVSTFICQDLSAFPWDGD